MNGIPLKFMFNVFFVSVMKSKRITKLKLIKIYYSNITVACWTLIFFPFAHSNVYKLSLILCFVNRLLKMRWKRIWCNEFIFFCKFAISKQTDYMLMSISDSRVCKRRRKKMQKFKLGSEQSRQVCLGTPKKKWIPSINVNIVHLRNNR